jgi:phytoene dehydrogenase-like protein
MNGAAEMDWEAGKEQVRQSVLRRLAREGIKDTEQHIKFEVCYTPSSWKSAFNLTHGAIFGSLNHSIFQMGWFRPHNQHRRYKNLFFVGGSTHPGNGVPMCLISAKLTAEKILKYHPS